MKYIKTFEVNKKSAYHLPPIKSEFVRAAQRGSNNAIKKLIKSGIDINQIDDNGNTALIVAVNNNWILIVETLINSGVDLNIKSTPGFTALMLATTPKILIKLLDAGADVNIQNSHGRTAIMMFLSSGFDLIKIMLNRKEEINLNLDIKDFNGNNFYDTIKSELEIKTIPNHIKERLEEVEKYMNEHFPQYKEDWDFKNDVNKFNL